MADFNGYIYSTMVNCTQNEPIQDQVESSTSFEQTFTANPGYFFTENSLLDQSSPYKSVILNAITNNGTDLSVFITPDGMRGGEFIYTVTAFKPIEPNKKFTIKKDGALITDITVERAVKDQYGNVLDTTYATKDEINEIPIILNPGDIGALSADDTRIVKWDNAADIEHKHDSITARKFIGTIDNIAGLFLTAYNGYYGTSHATIGRIIDVGVVAPKTLADIFDDVNSEYSYIDIPNVGSTHVNFIREFLVAYVNKIDWDKKAQIADPLVLKYSLGSLLGKENRNPFFNPDFSQPSEYNQLLDVDILQNILEITSTGTLEYNDKQVVTADMTIDKALKDAAGTIIDVELTRLGQELLGISEGLNTLDDLLNGDEEFEQDPVFFASAAYGVDALVGEGLLRIDDSGDDKVISIDTNTYLTEHQSLFKTVVEAADSVILGATYIGKMVQCTSAANMIITIPLDSVYEFAIGAEMIVVQYGTGEVTIAGETGVIVNSLNSHTKIAGQYGIVTLKKMAADTWLLTGDIAAA